MTLMSKNTMSVALPEPMRAFISARVNGGDYGNTSEYIRDLVRKDQTEQAKLRLRNLIEEGLTSGPALAHDDEDERELLAIARGTLA
jgi:antitoxin ParD1/3/4